jgi:plastocyanin
MSGVRAAAWCAIAAAIAVAACSKPESSSASGQASEPPASAPAAPASAATDTRVTGIVPNMTPGVVAIVMLEPKSAHAWPPQSEPPVMDQVGQTFGPPMLFVRTGQPVEFRNSDDTLHNVHVTNEDTHEGAFNVAIPTGNSYAYTFKQDGFYHVGCDIHPAMSAEIVSTTTPYATAAESDGRYEFADVAPGAYTLTMYAGGKKTQSEIVVRAPRSPGTPSPE